MRLMQFAADGGAKLGAKVDDEVVDLQVADPKCPSDMRALLSAGPDRLRSLERALAAAPPSARLPLSEVRLLPPVAQPGKILCLGLNYVDHAAEAGMTKPDHPVVFMRCTTSLVAAGGAIVRPDCSEQLDFEGELVAVIGTTARHVSRERALDHVAGYSVFNDASIRDYQLRTSQWTVGKNFDATGAFGPELVTADELPPGAAGLTLETRLNGEVVQHANTRDMVFDVAETIALLSESMTLQPGDLLVMGTPSGIGAVRKPPLWMKAGDVVEVEIEGVGLLRNDIRAEAAH